MHKPVAIRCEKYMQPQCNIQKKKLRMNVITRDIVLPVIIIACFSPSPTSSFLPPNLSNQYGMNQWRSTLGTYLKQSSGAGNVNSAMAVRDKVGLKPKSNNLQHMVQAMLKRKKFNSSLWKNIFSVLKKTAFKKNSIISIRDRDTPDSSIDINFYDAIFLYLKEENRWFEAMNLLELMETSSLNSKIPPFHPSPTLSSYHTVMSTLISANQSEKALEMLQSTSKKDIVPLTLETFEIAISMLQKRPKSNWRHCCKILEMMENLRIRPSTVIYNKVVSSCVKARELKSAMDILSNMKKRGNSPDTVTYNTLIAACASSKKWKEALRLFDEIQIQPGIDPDVITYTNAIKAYFTGGKVGMAFALFDVVKMKHLPLDVYVYTTVINGCSKAKLWRKALHFLDEMRTMGVTPNEYTYSAAISACGNGGKWEKALDLLNEMRENNMKVNVITYNSAITALAKTARINTRQSMNKHPSALDDPRDVVGVIDDEQLWKRALMLLEQMKKENVSPDVYSYSSAISACGACGRFQEALDLITIMRKRRQTKPNKIAYTGAISACARSGEWAPALKLFNDMKSDGIECDTAVYNALLSALSSSDKADEMFNLWTEMCSTRICSPDRNTLATVIAGLDRKTGKGNNKKIDKVFSDAVEREIMLPTDSMDTDYEIDLSGMTLPIAKAACRFILRQLILKISEGETCHDLSFITGVSWNNKVDSSESSHSPKQTGSMALREHIRAVLRDDFEPPLYSCIPKMAAGTVQVKKEVLKKWVDTQS